MASDRSDDRLTRLLSEAAPREVLGVSFDAVETGVVRRRRRQALVGSAAAVALVIGGGTVLAGTGLLDGVDRTSGEIAVVPSGPPSSTPTPSVVPPTAPPATAAPLTEVAQAPVGAAVAVALTSASAEVVWLDGSVARSLGALQGPDGEGDVRPVSVTSRGTGDATRRCLVWAEVVAVGETPTARVRCHRGRDARGTTIAGIGAGVTRVALSDDGRRLAWIEVQDSVTTVSVAELVADRVGGVVSADPSPGTKKEHGVPEGLVDLAWADGETLVLSIGADSDDGSRVALLDLASFDAGWQAARVVRLSDAEGSLEVLEGVTAAADGFAYAVQRERWCCDERSTPPRSRAVRVGLPGGAVMEVVGTADATGGRVLGATSGAGGTVVYATQRQGGTDPVFYVRRSGDGRGTPVQGLPVGTLALLL